MISTVSTCIVNDLGRGNFSSVNGLAESKNIKPLTVLLEKVPKWWRPFASRNYESSKFLIYERMEYHRDNLRHPFEAQDALIKISDMLSGDSDSIRKIGVTSKVLHEYYKDKGRTIRAGMTYSFNLFKELPGLKAEADLSRELTMKISSGGLEMVDIDEVFFEKEMRGRKVEMDHAYIKSFLGKPRQHLCVVKAVVQTIGKTVVEFNSSNDTKGSVSAEYSGQGGTVSADGNSRTIEKLTLEEGSVLACQWQRIVVDENSGEINLSYGENFYFSETPILQRGPAPDDLRFANLHNATEEEIKKLKRAIGAVLKSSSDIETLLDLLGGFDYEVEQFNRELKQKDTVWSVLELIGYELQGTSIKITENGPFKDMLPKVIEAISWFNSEELEFISRCDTNQIEQILSIVEILKSTPCVDIPMESRFINEAQHEPVKNVLEIMEVYIDFEKEKVSRDSIEKNLEPLMYLLYCL